MDERLVGKPTVALAQFFFNPGGARWAPQKKTILLGIHVYLLGMVSREPKYYAFRFGGWTPFAHHPENMT